MDNFDRDGCKWGDSLEMLTYDVASEALSFFSEFSLSQPGAYFRVWPSGKVSLEIEEINLFDLAWRIVGVMRMGTRNALQILDEADDLLRTAEFGLEDMKSRPGRARSGLRNAVIFGRNSTWALQNLRSVAPDFDTWYAAKQCEMKADPLMRYFHELRTKIEKQANTPTSPSISIWSFDSATDLQRFMPAPPGTVGFFMGDQNGGVGWEVQNPDGSIERYYVELPPDIGKAELHLHDAPPEVAQGRTAELLTEEYLSKVKAILREARTRFST